ncbi:hypothetical protein MesoLj113a_47180 [Mesorhizobium sp. 113-1-2]|uniref:hypothetical protein n=1 Tax=Mesorhizobium sp. 113-1-2 TaxID=2744515 RepID=UPI000819A2A7|nr:hypothetical protein [Mesorhizobium sp. 113-1-2]BAV45199.1 Uncharacterized protein MLTONO_0296 [Mesorhizobium loti]BCG73560.1 hypothetical protein MesoLj113a_47180 [Mesorhizobium sp. 113-1-2]
MHKKADAKEAIERLALEWMRETGYQKKAGHYPNFGTFKTWLEGKHFSHYLNFRSNVGTDTEASGWFETEINEYWRMINSGPG